MRQSRRFYFIAGIVAAVIILGFILSAPHLHDASAPEAATAQPAPLPIVYLRDSYKKGVHTITGKVAATDPCVIVSASASLAATSSIVVALSMPPDTGRCLAEPATTTFSVFVSAPASVVLSATINGTNASTSRY